MNLIKKKNLLMQFETKKRAKTTSSWALSYSDIVTTLLCFFIIFYALEKQHEKKTLNPLKGYAPIEGVLREHESSKVDTDYHFAIEELKKIPEIQVVKTSEFVDIFFGKIVFFNRGSEELTASGKKALHDVLSKFSKLEGKYTLEIQGHADSTAVRPVSKGSPRWWKTNMELSVLRALRVHEHLSDQYIEKNSLIVSGYGTREKITDSENNNDELNRRISLRLQLVK
jgi:chemotaxis protein MotB